MAYPFQSSKIEYTTDFTISLQWQDISSSLIATVILLLLKQNQQIANSTKCNEVDDKIVIQCVFTV